MNKLLHNHVLLTLFFGAIMLGMSWRTPMWMDEYVFYRLALSFPNSYAMDADIFFVDRPAMLSPNIDWENRGLDREEMFGLVYDTPVYPHTPLMPIIFSPIVKGLDWLADNEIIPHIEEEKGYPKDAVHNPEAFQAMRAEVITNILRLFSIAVATLNLWIIYKLMEKKVGKVSLFYGLPVGFSLMMLYGAFLFYWDVFMMFFFLITLYLMEVHPKSKWKYVTACALVNTKMFLGIAFLFPLFVKEVVDDYKEKGLGFHLYGVKMALPILSLAPFYIYSIYVTGNPLFFWEHYQAQVPLHDFIYTLNTPFDYVLIFFNLGMLWYIPMTAPIILFVKKYPAYVLFWLGSMFYAWATGLGITHTSTMVYSGALTFPLVAHEFNLFPKLRCFIHKTKYRVFRKYVSIRKGMRA